MNASKRALRQQQAAADGAFAARLVAACAALALVLWFALPSCESRRGGSVLEALGLKEAPVQLAMNASAAHRIPRLIHQTAAERGAEGGVPEVLRPLQESWHQHHATWAYKLWQPNDTLALVEEHFKWFRGTYESLHSPELRSAVARYMILYVHGGVFADLNVVSLRPIDPLLRGCGGLVALLSDDLPFPSNVPDALLASAPGHPLWLELLRAVKALTWRGWLRPPAGAPGPLLLKAGVAKFLAAQEGGAGGAAAKRPLETAKDVRDLAAERVLAVRVPGLCVAPAGTAYPYDYHIAPDERVDMSEERALARACSSGAPTFSRANCDRLLGIAGAAAYTIAYWTHAPLLDGGRGERVLRLLSAGVSTGVHGVSSGVHSVSRALAETVQQRLKAGHAGAGAKAHGAAGEGAPPPPAARPAAMAAAGGQPRVFTLGRVAALLAMAAAVVSLLAVAGGFRPGGGRGGGGSSRRHGRHGSSRHRDRDRERERDKDRQRSPGRHHSRSRRKKRYEDLDDAV